MSEHETPNQKHMREEHERDRKRIRELKSAFARLSNAQTLDQTLAAVRGIGYAAAKLLGEIEADQQADFERRYRFHG